MFLHMQAAKLYDWLKLYPNLIDLVLVIEPIFFVSNK
jgi:hypothetical protein